MTIKLLLLNLIFLVSALSLQAQDDAIAIAHADTTHFSVVKNTGWKLFNSYLALNTAQDSVGIELILEHANNIDWKQEQYVGKIKTALLLPKKEQTVTFNIVEDHYAIRIEPNGNCYIRFVSGKLPDDTTYFLPFKAVYKL